MVNCKIAGRDPDRGSVWSNPRWRVVITVKVYPPKADALFPSRRLIEALRGQCVERIHKQATLLLLYITFLVCKILSDKILNFRPDATGCMGIC